MLCSAVLPCSSSPSPSFASMRRGKRLHTRNRHLGNHRGSPVASSTGFSVACSNGSSLVSGMFQKIVTCLVDFAIQIPSGFQWHFPMDFHFCDFWCVIVCPDPCAPPPQALRSRRACCWPNQYNEIYDDTIQ